jgi:hypothetical protein
MLTFMDFQKRKFTAMQRLWNLRGHFALATLTMAFVYLCYDAQPLLTMLTVAALSVTLTKTRLGSAVIRLLTDPSMRAMDADTLQKRISEASAFVLAWFDAHTPEGGSEIEFGLHMEKTDDGSLFDIGFQVLKGAAKDLPQAALKELWDILDPPKDRRWISAYACPNEDYVWRKKPGKMQFSFHDKIAAMARVDRVEKLVTDEERLDPDIACFKRPGSALAA